MGGFRVSTLVKITITHDLKMKRLLYLILSIILVSCESYPIDEDIIVFQSSEKIFLWIEEIFADGRFEICDRNNSAAGGNYWVYGYATRFENQMKDENPKYRVDTINVYVTYTEEDFLKWNQQRVETGFNDTLCYKKKYTFTWSNIEDLRKIIHITF